MATTLGVKSCKNLVSLLILQGVIVCAFLANGKVSALKLLTTNKDAFEAFMEFGQQWNLTSELMERKKLHVFASDTAVVHDLRFYL